ncbi:MAG: TlpA disulfide reductase family protein [Rikenellaceae bacterium]
MRNTLSIITILIISTLTSCSGNKATIKGTICDLKDQTIILEEISGNDVLFIDSIKIDSKGKFSTTYKFGKDKLPVFLNLRNGDDYITLLVEPKEKIEIVSVINLSKNYTVEGSIGSSQLKDINSSLLKASHTIDSLYRAYNDTDSIALKENLLTNITKTYIKHKQGNIDFIIKNPSSLVSLVTLYQRMPNGITVFGDKNDILYFKLVNDSLTEKYPNSKYVHAMSRDIKEQENRNSLDEMIRNSIMNRETNGLPEIELRDIYGRAFKLSDLKGKVVLLSFWSYTIPNYGAINAEMRQIYEQTKDKGFEIYQVSLDENKAEWIGAVISQAIPWISVRDPQGAYSTVARNYNISTMPANFLIDREGNIAGKNIWGTDLTNKINSLTN